MRKLSVILVLLAVVVTAIWFATRTRVPSTASLPTISREAVSAQDAAGELVDALSSSEPASQAIARESVEPAPAPVQQSAPLEPKLAAIRGRFLLPGGAPAVGVALKVHGWEANNDRGVKYGRPEHWENPSGESDAEGRFSLRFDPPRAFQFTLGAKLEGWCEASWRWHEIEPASIVDVGDVELERGGSVRGHIADAKGRKLTHGWTVHARQIALVTKDASDGGRENTRVHASPDEATGEFLLEGLPPGRVHLTAFSRMANWIEGPIVDVRAGEEANAVIAYSGPDNSSRIVVLPFCRPFHVFEHDPAEVLLSGPGFEPRKATKIRNSSQSFSFEDVPPGTYTVEIRDPRFLPWSKSGVQPGEEVQAMLKGSAAVGLQVVDEATGESVPRFDLDVRFDRALFWPNTFRVHEAKADPPPGGLFDGLMPQSQTLIVRAQGYAACEVAVPDLAANEIRPVIARLRHGAEVVGSVVSGASKTPYPGAKVLLLAYRGSHDEWIDLNAQDELEAKSTQSDAQGKFSFQEVPAGVYTLRASDGKLLNAQVQLRIVQDQEPITTEVVMPAPAFLVGKLIGPEGARFDGLRLVARPAEQKENEHAAWRNREFVFLYDAAAVIAADGTFKHGPLPAGESAVSLCLPTVEVPRVHGSSGSEGMQQFLGTVTLLPGQETHKDFDLRELFPGTITVRARVNNEPASSAIVYVEQMPKGQLASAIVLDAHGEGTSGAILPGAYRLVAGPIDGSWVYADKTALTLGPSASLATNLDVRLSPGVLRVLDAKTRQPLANTQVFLTPDDGSVDARSTRATTNERGEARWTIAPGPYRVSAGAFPSLSTAQPPVTVDWTLSGAVPPEVAVTAKESPW